MSEFLFGVYGEKFSSRVLGSGTQKLTRKGVKTLQLNIGRRCNLACHHCHVESGPKRTEAMSSRDVNRVLEILLRNPKIDTLDITGGAPEMHPDFRVLVSGAKRLGVRVIDRCNLTILYEQGQEDTAEFLAQEGVEVIASLPCYSLNNVEKQRGKGVFGKSIDALRLLNDLGYGKKSSSLVLNLVHNPIGAELPPATEELERTYREQLQTLFEVQFNKLLTITNMPIKRFAHKLEREGRFEGYMSLLVNHFNPSTLKSLMCRDLISVGFDGRLWDCDFNQMLELPFAGETKSLEETIWNDSDWSRFEGQPIGTDGHCFGCTAGAGSSCGGALT
jgi:radical SAM/Cys-rich protein